MVVADSNLTLSTYGRIHEIIIISKEGRICWKKHLSTIGNDDAENKNINLNFSSEWKCNTPYSFVKVRHVTRSYEENPTRNISGNNFAFTVGASICNKAFAGPNFEQST